MRRKFSILVIKESLNNIARHADCERIDFSLEVLKHKFQITIEDDGRGFDLSSLRHFANGLSNMKMRMEQINGHYKIQSSPGKGTKTILSLPI